MSGGVVDVANKIGQRRPLHGWCRGWRTAPGGRGLGRDSSVAYILGRWYGVCCRKVLFLGVALLAGFGRRGTLDELEGLELGTCLRRRHDRRAGDDVSGGRGSVVIRAGTVWWCVSRAPLASELLLWPCQRVANKVKKSMVDAPWPWDPDQRRTSVVMT